MIIDCHGHYTTAPPQLQEFRDAQLDALDDPRSTPAQLEAITDDEIRQSIEINQLRIMRERGGDAMLLSPKASSMQHHVGDVATAISWARVSNELIHRITRMFPEHFAGVCQLPQTLGGEIGPVVAELRRCVELGFVGCNLNPDPSGGFWQSPPLTDRYWYPLLEAIEELDVPAMIHVSASRNPNFHALGAHYINADTAIFMQLLEGDLFADFPELRLVIPHGGGAIPYHWGRYQGLATRLGRPPLEEHVMPNVWFDTAVYHTPGMRLLLDVVGPDNVVFASEMLGAVRGNNPETGSAWDDTLRYLDEVTLDPHSRDRILEGNARQVYPRLAAVLVA